MHRRLSDASDSMERDYTHYDREHECVKSDVEESYGRGDPTMSLRKFAAPAANHVACEPAANPHELDPRTWVIRRELAANFSRTSRELGRELLTNFSRTLRELSRTLANSRELS